MIFIDNMDNNFSNKFCMTNVNLKIKFSIVKKMNENLLKSSI